MLLVSGAAYLELIEKYDDGSVLIMGPTGGQSRVSLAALEERGFAARQAHKLIKTDGSWMYMVAGKHGTDLYLEGRHSPATPVGMQSVRTL